MDVIEFHRRAVGEFVARADDVSAEQWSNATPCTDWDVRTLVNHIVGEDCWTVPLLRGRTIEEVGDEFDGDLLGDDALNAVHRRSAEAVAAVEQRVPAGGTVHLSYGDEDVEEYVRQLCADHLIHGWDVAAATGGDTRLDPELVEEVSAWFSSQEDMMRDFGVIGPRVQTEADDRQSQLLAAFGRDPKWGQ